MAKVWIGDYVSFDAATQRADLLPLLTCLRFAVDRARSVDFFLKGILTDRGGPAGGDPGWSIHWITDAEDALFPVEWKRCMVLLGTHALGCYEAWTHQPFSDLDPPCSYYAEDIVRLHAREVLGNFRNVHPERADEVDAAIRHLGLRNKSDLSAFPNVQRTMVADYRITTAIPPDRERIVSEIFFDDMQWAAVNQE